MKLFAFLLVGTTLFLFGCNTEKPKTYFPFQTFLEQELHLIDSLPVAIFKYQTKAEKTDTSIIEKAQFKEIAKGLLFLDLQEKETYKNYQELVLEDTDIKNISISYTTENETLPIKKLQLNIRTGTSAVRNFYVERTDLVDGITISRKILWNAGKGMVVNSIYFKNNKVQYTSSEKFSWSID
jgi:hypothetical protein